jgi:hypothetical protein
LAPWNIQLAPWAERITVLGARVLSRHANLVLAFLFCILLAYGLRPAYSTYDDEQIKRAIADAPADLRGSDASKFENGTRTAVMDDALFATRYAIVHETISAIGSRKIEFLSRTAFKTGNLIVAILFFGMLMIVGATEKSVRGQTEKNDEEARRNRNKQIEDGKLSVDDIFQNSIDSIRRDADRQFFQARLMLVAGIFVAIAGVNLRDHFGCDGR